MRRDDVVSIEIRRHFHVMCPLGKGKVIILIKFGQEIS